MPGQILVVEDDHTFLHLAAELIRVDGHIVFTAEDGIEALELLKAGQFDVVLTDYQMPKMNGIELIKAVKEIDPTLEIIVLTGHSSMELAIDIIRNGGFDLLRKPEDVRSRMRMTVNQALERRQLNSNNKKLVDELEQKIVEKTRESRRLAAQYQVTSILTGTDTLTELAPRILKTLLNNLGWQYGAIWSAERFTNKLHCTCLYARSEEIEDPFIIKRKKLIFQIGEGLPGKVWKEKNTWLNLIPSRASDFQLYSTIVRLVS